MATIDELYLHPANVRPASGSTGAQYKEAAGTNFPVPGVEYDADTDWIGYWLGNEVGGSGTIATATLEIQWYAMTATTGNVRWGAAIAAVTPGDNQDLETKAFAADAFVTSAHLGTTAKRPMTCNIALNLDGVAPGDKIDVKIYRDANDGTNDTLTGFVRLSAARIIFAD
jgi:hypothetical protein